MRGGNTAEMAGTAEEEITEVRLHSLYISRMAFDRRAIGQSTDTLSPYSINTLCSKAFSQPLSEVS